MASIAERIALCALAREGLAAIWHFQVEAAAAYGEGNPEAAEVLIEIADAAAQLVAVETGAEMKWWPDPV